MPACSAGMFCADARPRTLAGRRIAQARFEPSPCRRVSGFACPVVKSLLQPCGFRRPPSHESPPAAGHECACFVGCTKKLLLDRIYRIIRIMKSPKALAHCKNLVNPVNPVSKNEPWEEGLQLAYSWSRAAQIQSVREIGGDGPHETRILQTFHHSGEISATATLPRGFMVQ